MTIFRKAVRSFLQKKYYSISCCFCKKKVIPIIKNPMEQTTCDSCREYLLHMADNNSSLSEYDYNKIYVDNAKSDSF